MIGQPIVGSIEIEPLVFDARPKIPFPGDEEAMSVAKVIVERTAVAKLAVVVEETAIAGVVQFVIKKIAVIFIRWRRGRLGLVRRCSSDDRADGNKKQADKEQSYVFHGSRRLGYISDKPANPDVCCQKYSSKVIIREYREPLRGAQQLVRSHGRTDRGLATPGCDFT